MYLRINNGTLAENISISLFLLSAPNTQGKTRHYCEWLVHPITQEAVLKLPDDRDIPIHPDANVNILDPFLSPLVNQEELMAVQQTLESHKNSRLKFVDFLPPSLSGRIVTEQQLTEEGWYIT